MRNRQIRRRNIRFLAQRPIAVFSSSLTTFGLALPLTGFHHLTDEEAERVVAARAVLSHSVGIGRDDLRHQGRERDWSPICASPPSSTMDWAVAPDDHILSKTSFATVLLITPRSASTMSSASATLAAGTSAMPSGRGP